MSLLSSDCSLQPSINCLPLFKQCSPWALVFAFAKAGNSSPARMAMIAMTTSSSMSVKPQRRRVFWDLRILDDESSHVAVLDDRSGVYPFMDFRMAVGKRKTAGFVMITCRPVNPLGG